jgi:hypothetical protein
MPIGWRRAKMWRFGPTTCAIRCTWADEAFVLRMQALASDRAVSDKEIPKAQRASPKSRQDWLALMPSRDDAIAAAHRHSQ